MARKKRFPLNPKILRECRPGAVVLCPIGAGGNPSKVQVRWHWPDGDVCVHPMQIEGCVEHCTLYGGLVIKPIDNP